MDKNSRSEAIPGGNTVKKAFSKQIYLQHRSYPPRQAINLADLSSCRQLSFTKYIWAGVNSPDVSQEETKSFHCKSQIWGQLQKDTSYKLPPHSSLPERPRIVIPQREGVSYI